MICNDIDWSATASMLSAIATIAAVLVAYSQLSKLSQQIRETHDWNRRKTSQEILNTLVFGEFPTLRTKLEVDLSCNIPDHNETYDLKRSALSDENKTKLDDVLRRVLNILETIAINIKHNIIDEDICYDYLGWIMVDYHRWSATFIEQRRQRTGDPRLLVAFSEFAEKWEARLANEKQSMANAAIVPPKKPL